MKILIMGGTRFIGRAVTEQLVAAGHEVVVMHRGQGEPKDFPDVPHIHCERQELTSVRSEIDAVAADAFLDTGAFGKADTEIVVDAVSDIPKKVMLSSCDVYRAYGAVHSGIAQEPVPVDEQGPVRDQLYPYRGMVPGMDDYEKLEAESQYLAVGGSVMRLGIIYGPHDYQRREEFILSRVRAGKKQIPFGAGNWLATRCFVKDVAASVRLVLESPDANGVYNVGEPSTLTVRLWAEKILEAAGSEAELVRVPDDALPEDLGMTAAMGQHLLTDSARLRYELGWKNTALPDAIAESVAWHLAHPPQNEPDLSVDEDALAKAS